MYTNAIINSLLVSLQMLVGSFEVMIIQECSPFRPLEELPKAKDNKMKIPNQIPSVAMVD